MMNIDYIVLPFLSWFVAGCLKFVINFMRFGKNALNKVGYGGLPSNHTTIVTAMPAYIGFENGISEPAFGACLTLAFIVTMDAMDLRRKVGKHASAINALNNKLSPSNATAPLRESVGHSLIEVFAGIVLGVSLGYWVSVANI